MAIYNQRVDLSREELDGYYYKRDSIWYLLYGIIRFLGIIIQNLYCVSSYLVLSWLIFFPINWIRTDLYSNVENCLYNSLLFIVSSWSAAAGLTVVEVGDEFKNLIEEPDANQEGRLEKEHNSEKLNGVEKKRNHKNSNHHITSNGNNVRKKVAGDMVGSLERSKLANFRNASPYSNYELCSPEPKRDHQRKPRILLLCNHISTADVPLIMQSLSTLTNQSILWVLDAQVSYQF